MNAKPWYKSLTLWGAAITGVGVFLPKYAPLIPQLANDAATIVGLVATVIGRLRATKQVTFTGTQQ